jgi:hypothetical protein
MTSDRQLILWLEVILLSVFALGLTYYLFGSWKSGYVMIVRTKPHWSSEYVWRDSEPWRYWWTMVSWCVCDLAAFAYVAYCLHELFKS